MKIGLFFGSFNPVHVGHIILANHIQQHTDLEQIWLIVSPHNPHKKKSTLANDYERLHMVNLAIEDYPYLKSSNIEFGLPKPSYTINTLALLSEKYPEYSFHLIMGSDNLVGFHKWKNFEQILNHYSLYVYPRKESEIFNVMFNHQNKITRINAPLLEISSSLIRKEIKEKKNFKPLLPEKVWLYIDGSSLYR